MFTFGIPRNNTSRVSVSAKLPDFEKLKNGDVSQNSASLTEQDDRFKKPIDIVITKTTNLILVAYEDGLISCHRQPNLEKERAFRAFDDKICAISLVSDHILAVIGLHELRFISISLKPANLKHGFGVHLKTVTDFKNCELTSMHFNENMLLNTGEASHACLYSVTTNLTNLTSCKKITAIEFNRVHHGQTIIRGLIADRCTVVTCDQYSIHVFKNRNGLDWTHYNKLGYHQNVPITGLIAFKSLLVSSDIQGRIFVHSLNNGLQREHTENSLTKIERLRYIGKGIILFTGSRGEICFMDFDEIAKHLDAEIEAMKYLKSRGGEPIFAICTSVPGYVLVSNYSVDDSKLTQFGFW